MAIKKQVEDGVPVIHNVFENSKKITNEGAKIFISAYIDRRKN